MNALGWLERVDWLWMIIGGFYLVAYLFWYIPALAALPGSVVTPPSPFPWHWTLDFLATAIAGGALLALGFGRATSLSPTAGTGGRSAGD